MSDDRYMDKLTMTRSALDALVKAVPDQLVKEIVADQLSSGRSDANSSEERN